MPTTSSSRAWMAVAVLAGLAAPVVAQAPPHDVRHATPAPPEAAGSAPAWGRVDATAERLGRFRFLVEDWPADGRLPVPAGFSQIVRATLRGPQARDLAVALDARATAAHLLLPPDRPADVPLPAVVDVEVAERTGQFADGRIVLTAREARVAGGRAKLESQPGNHRIGFWTDPADAVAWTWQATRWGAYDARLTFSNASPAGTEIEVTIGDETLVAALPATGDWYRYATLPLGRVVLPRAGDVSVRVRCTKLAGGAVMNLKALVLEPACEGRPPVQAADGVVTLHGRDATVLGTTLRYEPAEAKQTLGFWTQPTDAATWTFTVNTPGVFDVEVLQGCGTGRGGSEMAVALDPTPDNPGQRLTFTVEDTGGFQAFRARVIGRVELESGGHSLRIQPVRIAKGAACDVRQIRLVPVEP